MVSGGSGDQKLLLRAEPRGWDRPCFYPDLAALLAVVLDAILITILAALLAALLARLLARPH